MTGRLIRVTSVLVLSLALLLFWPTSPEMSVAEDIRLDLPERISDVDIELGVGAAFDGSTLWFTLGYAFDTNIYGIDPTTGDPVGILDMVALTEGRNIVPGGLAWDAARGHLWVATMFDVDANEEGLAGDGEIFEIDPAGPAIVSSFATSPITEVEEPFTGFIDGLAYDSRSDNLWFSPLESLHVYEVTVAGDLISSFTLPFGPELWNAGITFDGNHLWLSLRTGGIFREGLEGLTDVTLVEFTADGDPLGIYVRETGAVFPEDLAFDDVTFAPACVVWTNSVVGPLTALEVPCPLRVEATMHPGETLDLEKMVSLPDFLPFPADESTDVSWQVECDPLGIDVTLQPETIVGVGFGTTVSFDESIGVPLGTAVGEYNCVVSFLSSAVPEGTVFEQQFIRITVEAMPLVQCDPFDAEVEIEDDEFEVEGSCTLGLGSDGIDPPNEDVTLVLGPYTVTIPAGSFEVDDEDDEEEWEFEGVIDGVELEAEIEAKGENAFEFEFEGEGADLTGIENPVEVTLTVGDDIGTAMVYVEFDDDDDDDSPLAVPLDIKPRSCRNPLNVKKRGVLPVAILGTENFDVSQIDPSTIRLEGVAPLRWSMEDVATPFEPFLGKEDAYDCTDEGPDGFVDLTLKFRAREIVEALGRVRHGDVLVLEIEGTLWDGTPFQGEDVVVILKKGKGWHRRCDISPQISLTTLERGTWALPSWPRDLAPP